jgi:HPt (histidine-containing phosphotransfer) domain-containing protein
LKGTAGNIGARALQSAAGELEHACGSGADKATIEALLVKVLAELDPVLAGLQQIDADESAAAGAAQGIPDEEVRAALDRLATLLEDNDAAAGDLLNELLDRTAGTAYADALKPVAASINDYDFDEALARLKKVSV